MCRLAVFVSASVLITQPSAPSDIYQPTALGGQPPPEAEQITQHYFGWSCGSPFYTLAEGRAAADAILHVRLDHQVTYDHLLATGESEVATAHEATVLDVFKTHPFAMPAGSSMTILQRGGIIRRAEGWHRHLWNSFETMPVATEWVLFLRWNPYWEGFEVVNFEEGAFQIEGDTIATPGRGAFPEKWQGKAASAFLAALKEPSS